MDVGAAEGHDAMMRTRAAACDPDTGDGPTKFLAASLPRSCLTINTSLEVDDVGHDVRLAS